MDYFRSRFQEYQWDLVQHKKVRSVYVLSRDNIPELYIKIYHPTSFFQRLRNFVYPKTLKERDRLRQLHSAGFRVPDVVSHLRHGYTSALVTRAVFPSTSLRQLPESRTVDIMLALASELLGKGFYYGDFHADNIILDESDNPYLVDAYSIVPITTPDVRTTTKLFSQIAAVYTICDTVLEGCIRSLLPEEDLTAMVHTIQRKALASRRRLVQRRVKRTFRQGSFTDIITTDSYRAIVRHDAPIALDAVMAEHRQNVEKRHNLLKYQDKTQLSRVGSFCVKSYRTPKPLTSPYARRAWRGLLTLFFNKIPVADPVALVEFNDRSSMLITGYLDDPDLNRILYHQYHEMSLREKTSIARQLGEQIGMIHRYGIYHADLKAANIKVRKTPLTFLFLDTDKVHQSGHISDTRRLKNLVQINISVPRHVTRGIRMAFVQAYASITGDNPRVLFRQTWELSVDEAIVYRTDQGDRFESW